MTTEERIAALEMRIEQQAARTEDLDDQVTAMAMQIITLQAEIDGKADESAMTAPRVRRQEWDAAAKNVVARATNVIDMDV